MAKYKVVHYINQFYAGMGGEDTASVGISVRDGAVGPGLALKANLGADYEIVKTIICGDNTIAEKTAEIVPQIVELVKKKQAPICSLRALALMPDVTGIGCGATTAAVTEQLRIPAVTALSAENPGTDIYKNRCYILQTENSAKNMRKTAAFMAAFAKRLVEGDTIKDGKEEHYHGSGPAVVIDYSIPAAKRGIDMLLAKHAGRPFHTEVVMPNHEEIPVPVLTKPLSERKIRPGHGWRPCAKGQSRSSGAYQFQGVQKVFHSRYGYAQSPRLGRSAIKVITMPLCCRILTALVPVDALRKLVKAGVVGSMDDAFYSTAGVMTPMEKCKKFGEGIAKGLIADGCDAAIETST